jgi:hypothetical protein
MEARDRILWLVIAAVGLVDMVLAVLLFGLTTASGAPDWVSIITAVAGLGMVVTGLYLGMRGRWTRPNPSGPTPHTF